MRTSLFFIFILGFIFFVVPNFTLAVSPPLNPIEEILDEQHQFMSIQFRWDRSTDPSVEWYHLVYTCKQNCSNNPGDAAWVVQPTDTDPVSRIFIGGFDYSLPTAETRYGWRVGACSAQADGDCVFTSQQVFVTGLQPPPPNNTGGGNGGGNGGGGGGGGGPAAFLENPISSENLPELLENVLNFLFGLSIIILPIIVVYGGILLLTAGGDPEKVSKSRTILLWAVVAFAIILLARGLPTVLRSLL